MRTDREVFWRPPQDIATKEVFYTKSTIRVRKYHLIAYLHIAHNTDPMSPQHHETMLNKMCKFRPGHDLSNAAP